MNKVEFEIIGYLREYYCGGFFMGSENLTEPDREVFGYEGRKPEIAKEKIKFKKRQINTGEMYYTILYPLNGKIKK